uniref:Uncharacterized protein n=1 Tax=Romanomermis culicivorax TaxID=13658 RepID=A0A915HLR4_ROMCU
MFGMDDDVEIFEKNNK